MFSAELKKGSMELLILALLAEKPHHGYEIGRLIEDRSLGRLQFRVTSLYPVLYRMESRGWIKSRWVEKDGERRRNYYFITPAGEKMRRRQLENWKEFMEAVHLVLGADHA